MQAKRVIDFGDDALTAVDNPVHYRRSVTSQWGEDGIVEEIFKRIGTQNKFCIEFGAWDGKYLSNTWVLWHDREWSAILIEGDEERIASLESNTRGYERVTVYRKYVSLDGPTSLDSILSALGVPQNPDLLSIDVDGDDYYIFDSLQNFSPRVVVIEHNPTIPPGVELVQTRGEYFGASASALAKLAKSKGYGLVCCTETNCFFVLASEYEALGIQEPELARVFPSDNLTYLVTSQDGHAFLTRQPTYSGLSHASLSNCLKIRAVREDSFPKLAGPDQLIPIMVQVPSNSAPSFKKGISKLCGTIWSRLRS